MSIFNVENGGTNFQPAQGSRERDEMKVALPRVIKEYIDASNAHDVERCVSCFSDDALVRTKGKDFRGKKTIEDWVVKTIEKYKFRSSRSLKKRRAKIVVSVEVSGTFPGAQSAPIITSRLWAVKSGLSRSSSKSK